MDGVEDSVQVDPVLRRHVLGVTYEDHEPGAVDVEDRQPFLLLGGVRPKARSHTGSMVMLKYSELTAYAFIFVIVGNRVLDLLPVESVDEKVSTQPAPRRMR